MSEKEIGYVSNYFSELSVSSVEITNGTVSLGDTLHFKGRTTDFISKVGSMQIDHEPITVAKKGDSIGVKVSEKVRKHDRVYKVTED